MLRRTKLQRASELKLPPLTIDCCELELAPDERDFYESIFKQTAAKFDSFVRKGTVHARRPLEFRRVLFREWV